jgi:hypothetical protein
MQAGVTGVSVTSERYGKTIHIKWEDGPSVHKLRETTPRVGSWIQVRYERRYSRTAWVWAAGEAANYLRAKDLLGRSNLENLPAWVTPTRKLLEAYEETSGNRGWDITVKVARICKETSVETLKVALQLKEEGSPLKFKELLMLAESLNAA